MEFSILDYAMIDEGKDAAQALQDTTRLAKLADDLGYKRFWLTEHHDVPAFAGSSPELLMMHLLGQTERIKLGSGGVMLPHYSPFKVAENFKMLEALYPGRVDLGIGNNPGTAIVKRAMDEDKADYLDYRQSIEDIRSYLTQPPEKQRVGKVIAQPQITRHPEMWLLSTSQRSTKFAATQGMGYTLGTFLLPSQDKIDAAKNSVATYRSHFQKTELNMAPKVMLTAFMIVTDTEDEAQQLLHALDVWLLGKRQFAEFERFPSIETAKDYQLNDRDKRLIAQHRARILAGTVEQVKPRLDAMIEAFEADEVLVVPLLPGIEQRCRTIELLAHAYL
ncbi:LLM class flavin-dependent oxidoreductase [Staphylococcus petrasii]|uniref:LLM class flavin-dependent oxidoreductase n=1 Tax=Staphylococcus petrasii TaxID=1276936 RepID=UPI000CD2C7D3|nr:LLM class flavin-dependent oxidoreductase [Staphylococcus petrasii]PNZ84078.1 LLM class flavin-dependent oxidoreductase [Staphylococcus petrasii]TGA81396.1 LLM class flavin-dependent oxidoreductase [Staphylococcus petrasii]SUM58866.1 Luciferase-like monooxygenase [Staphylococcus petrasii]